MAFDLASSARSGGSWGVIATLATADGSATHPLLRRLASRHAAVRDLADAVHVLCALHGRHPGLIDLALARCAQPSAHAWLTEVAESFGSERAYLARLAAAAGPLPSTPGQAVSEAAVLAQCHALEMLAQSDRAGCATGAVIALLLDWSAIRATLDTAAERFGVAVTPLPLMIEAEIATVAAALGNTPGTERAMAFGAQQVLAQHRGLWDLLDARASARGRG